MNKTFGFIRKLNYGPFTWYCGYVGIMCDNIVPISHQGGAYGDDCLDTIVTCHGGITFDNYFNRDKLIIPVTEIPNDWFKYRCIGFDLNHFDDEKNGISNNFEYAKQEVLKLKEQIDNIIRDKMKQTNISTGD